MKQRAEAFLVKMGVFGENFCQLFSAHGCIEMQAGKLYRLSERER
jgi:hypothetical protein